MWLVYSDWILPFRKALHYLWNGIMLKTLEFLLIFYKLSITATNTALYSCMAHRSIKQVHFIFSLSPFISPVLCCGKKQTNQQTNQNKKQTKTKTPQRLNKIRFISCSPHGLSRIGGSPTETLIQLVTQKPRLFPYLVATPRDMWQLRFTEQEETAQDLWNIFRDHLGNGLRHLCLCFMGQNSESDPQHNYKEGWEEWILLEFQERRNDMLNIQHYLCHGAQMRSALLCIIINHITLMVEENETQGELVPSSRSL